MWEEECCRQEHEARNGGGGKIGRASKTLKRHGVLTWSHAQTTNTRGGCQKRNTQEDFVFDTTNGRSEKTRRTPAVLIKPCRPRVTAVSCFTTHPRFLGSRAQSAGSPLQLLVTTSEASTRMAKSKKVQQRRGSRCPVCFHFFSDVLRHLNHRQSRCSAWLGTSTQPNSPPPRHDQDFEDTFLPDPPPPHSDHQQAPSPAPSAPSHIYFPGAGATYGQAQTFLDRFNEDQYAPFRAANRYYPFSNEVEWELASFLLSSNMSMRKVDEMLKLKLVSLLRLFTEPHSYLFRFRMQG